MARCNNYGIKSEYIISLSEITHSVAGFSPSLLYMQKMLPLVIYNTVYNCFDVNEDFFLEKHIVDGKYVTLRTKIEDAFLIKINQWCKSIVKMISSEQVKSIYMFFINKQDNSLIESFTFELENSKSTPEKPVNKYVILDRTEKLFESLESLRKFPQHNPDDFKVTFEIITHRTNDNVYALYPAIDNVFNKYVTTRAFTPLHSSINANECKKVTYIHTRYHTLTFMMSRAHETIDNTTSGNITTDTLFGEEEEIYSQDDNDIMDVIENNVNDITLVSTNSDKLLQSPVLNLSAEEDINHQYRRKCVQTEVEDVSTTGENIEGENFESSTDDYSEVSEISLGSADDEYFTSQDDTDDMDKDCYENNVERSTAIDFSVEDVIKHQHKRKRIETLTEDTIIISDDENVEQEFYADDSYEFLDIVPERTDENVEQEFDANDSSEFLDIVPERTDDLLVKKINRNRKVPLSTQLIDYSFNTANSTYC